MKKAITIPALLLGVSALGWLGVRGGADGPGGAAVADAARSSPGVPVTADVVRATDVPVYLSGLGTARAFNSVLVRSRVDGQLVKVDFTEGQEVHAGDVIAEIDPRPYAAALAQAQAARLKDQAQLDNARLDSARFTGLSATGGATTQQRDTAHALVAQLAASVGADEAQIDLARLQLEYATIRSPIDGRAGARLLDAGNMVRATDAAGIVTINQIRPIFVSFALPAADLPELRARLKRGDVAVVAEDGDGRELAAGKLAMIDNAIAAGTATIALKATFDNAEEALWPGQFVNIRLLLEVRRAVLTVPVTAVVRGAEGPYAFVIGADRVVEKRPVAIGFTTPTMAVVDRGLAAGERVVTDGQYRIEAGRRVEVQAPGAARETAK